MQLQSLNVGITHRRSLQQKLKALYENHVLHRVRPPAQTNAGRIQNLEYLYAITGL
jgi:hypothetical protein